MWLYVEGSSVVVCMLRKAVWLSVCRGKQCGCLYVEGSSVVVCM